MEEDQGIYQCTVTNDDGSVISDSVNITVQGIKIRYYLYTYSCVHVCRYLKSQ